MNMFIFLSTIGVHVKGIYLTLLLLEDKARLTTFECAAWSQLKFLILILMCNTLYVSPKNVVLASS